MKYTMLGFSQKSSDELGLDILDLAILRWFIDFKNSGTMKVKRLQGENYYWISYKAISEDLHILHLKKDAIYKRLRKMCDAKILKKRVVCEFGKYSFFELDKNYYKLINNHSKQSSNTSQENVVPEDDLECKNDVLTDTDLVQNAAYFFPDSTDEISNLDDIDMYHSDQNQGQNIILSNNSYKLKINKENSPSSRILATQLLDLILQNNPNFKIPNLKKWEKTFNCILYYDTRNPEEVADLIKWVHTESSFWSCHILSPSDLRKKYDRLVAQKSYDEYKDSCNSMKNQQYNTDDFIEI